MSGQIGAVRGTALFVAAIVGPGILTLPALAAARSAAPDADSLGSRAATDAGAAHAPDPQKDRPVGRCGDAVRA